MRSFWSEPFLWIHLAGLAAVPICLEACCLFLAVGDPVSPGWVEMSLVAVVGIAPVFWMQWSRPFSIFSILAVAMKPEQLTDEQRCLLSQFKTPGNKFIAGAAAVFMLGLLWLLYQTAPLVASKAAFLPQWRLAGLLAATLAFLAGNLFLQVSLSVARVLFISEAAFWATPPYPLERICQEFTIPGLQVNQILPAEISQASAKMPAELESAKREPASSD
ncbi:low-complexity tail membrane protein [Funiculus sociatus]|uniref:low-complexity tail membrane protein n=1 Tax=Funiculus sociatus TaxID=450527 RepID=UPI0032994262